MMLPLRLVHVVQGVPGRRFRRVTGDASCYRSCRRLLSNVAAVLESRAVLEISGVDAKALLQGLMTNDMALLDEGNGKLPCISTAFLTPKGRVMGDALVTRIPRYAAKNKQGYLLDCPLSVAEGLKSHLKLYKLRSKVKIKDATSLYDVLVSGVHDPWQASSTDDPERGDVSPLAETPGQPDGASTTLARFVDPRCAALGVRSIRPKGEADSDGFLWPEGDTVVPEDRYHALRMVNGIGEGTELLDSIPLESNLDLLGSISFTKGCYVGQELTARTQFKGFVRKRVLPVLFVSEEAGASASPIQTISAAVAGAGKSGGLLHSTWGSKGSGGVPPKAGTGIVDQEAGDGKLGTVVAVSPEYSVGLALLRLSKIMSAAPSGGAEGSAHPAVDCRLVGGSGQEEQRQRCQPLTPTWWPADLDPTTGKVPT